METLGKNTPSGLHAGALRVWGLLFLAAGIISRSILQNRILGVGVLTAQQLIQIMSDSRTMVMATAALVLQAVETCAAPIFAFLLVLGFTQSADRKKYLLRVAGAAIVSELPYNLAMSGKLLDFSTRNPVFGLVLALVLLYFFRRFAEKSFASILIKACVLAAAIVWAYMLGIDHGIPFLLLTAVLWALRSKPQLRILLGTVVGMACSIVSPFYLASAMGFLPVYMYNCEKGPENRLVSYLAYPVLLLAISLAAHFAF